MVWPGEGFAGGRICCAQRFRVQGPEGPGSPPTQGFNDPTLGFNDPTLGFNDPIQGFNDPTLGFNDPTLGFNDPILGFNDPTLGVNDPTLGFNAPHWASMSMSVVPPMWDLDSIPRDQAPQAL